jgi:hypothetical protein
VLQLANLLQLKHWKVLWHNAIKAQKALNLFGSQNVRKDAGCEIIFFNNLFLYSVTNAFQPFNYSRLAIRLIAALKLAIRLIATLIFDPMFI